MSSLRQSCAPAFGCEVQILDYTPGGPGCPMWSSTPEQEKAMHWEADTSLIDTAREIAPIIQKYNQEAERERRLSRPVLNALRETGLLRMSTPRSLGGLETDPITRALVVEEISRHDSAAGWTLENPLDWAFFCARLPDEGAEEIYSRGADILIAAQFGLVLTCN